MRRFGRKLDVARLRGELPLTPFFFDILHLDGQDLIDRPAGERFAALGEAVPGLTVPRLVTADAEEADAFFAEALARGHEGIMAKAVDAPYEAGRRGFSWLKIKPAHTLDLVVLAAEWGHGRRQRLALEPPPRSPRSRERRLRDARQDLQGPDRRDPRLADRRSSRSSPWAPTAGPSTSAPSWSSRSPSATSRRARNTPAAWPSASPASSATATTRRRPRRIRSRRCGGSSRGDVD